MYIKPNFLIVGAAKAGTTSLAKYIAQHPDIFIPEKKELRYFIADVINSINRKDPLYRNLLVRSVLNKGEYYKSFVGKEKYAGEASVHYLFHYNEAIPKILGEIGDIPIIIILRNPIERAISNWLYIQKDHLTFEEAIKDEETRIKNKYNSFWYYKKTGLYYDQVKAYMDAFSKVKVFLFEDLKNNSTNVVNEIFEFLDIPQIEVIDTTTIYNTRTNYIPKGFLLKKLSGYRLNKYLQLILKKINLLNYFYIKKSKKISADLHCALVQFYTPDINKLEQLINRDLSKWKV